MHTRMSQTLIRRRPDFSGTEAIVRPVRCPASLLAAGSSRAIMSAIRPNAQSSTAPSKPSTRSPTNCRYKCRRRP